MPLYEYYCTRCATKYELLRSMGRSDDPATCPNGHKGGARTLSLFASVTNKIGGGDMQDYSSGSGGGGCGCGGGGCGCGGH
jgi:putative FmdB family regulatory protein